MDVHQNYFNIAVCLKHFIIKYWEGKITITQNLYTQIWTAVSFLIPMNWKQAHYSPGSEFLAKLSSSYTMEYHSAIKRTEYWYTEQPGWIWRELTWVKKATSQRLYTLRFHLYKILKKEKKNRKKGTNEWLPEVQNEMGEGSGYGCKRQYKRSLILFYPDCSGGYMSLHVRKSYGSVDTHTHTNRYKENWGSLKKWGGLYLTASVSLSWLWYCTIVLILEDSLILEQGLSPQYQPCTVQHLGYIFLTPACESTIISTKTQLKN